MQLRIVSLLLLVWCIENDIWHGVITMPVASTSTMLTLILCIPKMPAITLATHCFTKYTRVGVAVPTESLI